MPSFFIVSLICTWGDRLDVPGSVKYPHMAPKYDLDKIKFATDPATFQKAVELYEAGKVIDFKEGFGSYSARVLGTKPYRVSVEARRYDYGNCDCYLGQNDTLCKHQVALALRVVLGGRPLTEGDKLQQTDPSCSGKVAESTSAQLVKIKQDITAATRYIKPYSGPSRIWFAYQNSLDEGCNRLSAIVSDIPVNLQTAKLLVGTLLRLDRKLTHSGVDDSNGTVGGFIQQTVDVLREFARLCPACIPAFRALKNQETCFGWEEPLLRLGQSTQSTPGVK